ncbi:hypothetical protein BDW72DRAFT_209604 [Aspergillus terricola var. indicus]
MDSLGSCLQHNNYIIAWICALPIEMAAAWAMLDEVHKALPTYAEDSNTYILGSIAQYNVVIACLPAGQYGINNAVNIMSNMKQTFPSIRAGLIVGIGGGVPGKADVRLGDIIVGTRVMQYDLGKMVGDGQIYWTAFPRIPHQLLQTAVSSLQAKHKLQPSQVSSILRQKLGEHSGYTRPSSPDRLFYATYNHLSSTIAGCDACDHLKLVPRRKRTLDNVVIYYGAIASGNQVMKTGIIRDKIAQQLDVICFEMEAAGLMNILPCLPIRGICDYTDSHKNNEWQRYAAAVAAAYAREFLLKKLPVTAASKSIVYTPNHCQCSSHEQPHERRQRFLKSLRFKQIDASWLDPEQLKQNYGFLWISGKPGAGKSTIMKFAYLKNKACYKHAVTASFFFNARGELLERLILGIDLVSPTQSGCPSLNALKGLFCNAITALVVDIVLYFKELAEKSTVKGVPLWICFSSQHYPYITIRQGVRHILEDQPGHAEDMAIYITAGVFMGGLALRRQLVEIPSDLSELFRDILRRDNKNIEDLLLCILWILYAKQPLQPKEFYHALYNTIYHKCVISSLKGLAEITKSKKPTIQFIHESVQDFLIKDNSLHELWPDLGLDFESQGHKTLKQSCSLYINHVLGLADVSRQLAEAEPKEYMEIPKKYPFLEYATQHVLNHANAVLKLVPQDNFLSAFPVSDWVNASNIFEKFKARRYSPDISIFYLLAEKGLSHVLGGRYRYPLFAALATCNRDAAAALLMSPSRFCDGVDITEGLNHRKDLKGYENRTPLSWAAQEGQASIVKLLLQTGSSVNEVDMGGETPLLRASWKGHEAMARLMVDKGADVNASAMRLWQDY